MEQHFTSVLNTDPTVYEEQQAFTYPEEVDYRPPLEADPNKKSASIIFQFIKSLKIGSDLSQIASPIQADKGKSGLEYGAQCNRVFDSVINIHREPSAAKRMIQVVHAFLAPRTYIPLPALNGPTKPFNSVLGEHFHCHWNHSDQSQTFSVWEQISHHPPISAFYTWNQRNNFSMEGTAKVAPIFWGNKVQVAFYGLVRFNVFLPDGTKEVYQISLPYPTAKGILLGKSSFELSGDMKVVCEQTGLEANLKFKSGNVVKGEITEQYEREKNGAKKMKTRTIYEIEGSVISVCHVINVETKEKTVLFDAQTMENLQMVIKPVVKQDVMESQRLWHHVTYNIKKQEWEEAVRQKTELEESQRRMIKEMKANNQEYVPKYFKKTDLVHEKVTFYEYIHPITHYMAPVENKVDDLDLD